MPTDGFLIKTYLFSYHSNVHHEVQNALTDALKSTSQKFGWQHCNLRYRFLCQQCPGPTQLSKSEPFPNRLWQSSNKISTFISVTTLQDTFQCTPV